MYYCRLTLDNLVPEKKTVVVLLRSFVEKNCCIRDKRQSFYDEYAPHFNNLFLNPTHSSGIKSTLNTYIRGILCMGTVVVETEETCAGRIILLTATD